jgi:hypothetical protein
MKQKQTKKEIDKRGTAIYFRIEDEGVIEKLHKLKEKDHRNSLADYIRVLSIKAANGEIVSI